MLPVWNRPVSAVDHRNQVPDHNIFKDIGHARRSGDLPSLLRDNIIKIKLWGSQSWLQPPFRRLLPLSPNFASLRVRHARNLLSLRILHAAYLSHGAAPFFRTKCSSGVRTKYSSGVPETARQSLRGLTCGSGPRRSSRNRSCPLPSRKSRRGAAPPRSPCRLPA
jgi:hypothetical protein